MNNMAKTESSQPSNEDYLATLLAERFPVVSDVPDETSVVGHELVTPGGKMIHLTAIKGIADQSMRYEIVYRGNGLTTNAITPEGVVELPDKNQSYTLEVPEKSKPNLISRGNIEDMVSGPATPDQVHILYNDIHLSREATQTDRKL
jgi:hypothetical protein